MEKYWAHIVMSDNEEWEGDVYKAKGVDEVIMNMVDEFAETAKEYESDRAKDKEEIARLRKALEKIAAKWHDNFDTCVDIAREALADKDGE